MSISLSPSPEDVIRGLGLRPIINAAGGVSRLGNSRPAPAVIEAMQAASQCFIPMDELQAWASDVIVAATGAEAGCVGPGAAACMFMAACACITGLNVAAMDRLPDTTGLRNEIVMHRAQRNAFDHALRASGARIVEFGYLQEGAGARTWQLEDAITERTAAVFYVASPTPGILPLSTVCEIAHKHGLPVIVDGAPALPPVQALRSLIEAGADLVAHSGSKVIGGPAASGFLAGRRDLILAATLQQQDMHVRPETWSGPLGEPETELVPLPPHQGIGRMLKLGREEIVGLVVALRRFLERDLEAEQARWQTIVDRIASSVEGVPGLAVRTTHPPATKMPQLVLKLEHDPSATAARVSSALRRGSPRVFLADARLEIGELVVNPLNIADEEVEPLIGRLREVVLQEVR